MTSKANLRSIAWRKIHPEVWQRYYASHRQERLNKSRQRYQEKSGLMKSQSVAWSKANPEKVRQYKRKHNTGLNLTEAEWQALFDKQGRVCALCGTTKPRGGRWVTDHNHQTDAFRGIICKLCNVGIGALQDDLELVALAYEYLEREA